MGCFLTRPKRPNQAKSKIQKHCLSPSVRNAIEQAAQVANAALNPAAPAAALTDGTDNLPLGTTGGYNNPSDVANSTVITNQVTYTATAGVVGYTVDYDVAYDVPALVGSGSYTGTVAFVLAAN